MEKPTLTTKCKRALRLLQTTVFPVEAYELKKLIPLLIMFSAVALCYSALRSLKDSVVLGSEDTNAGTIALIKGLLVVPCAMAGKWGYLKLRSLLGDRSTFTVILMLFASYFVLHSMAHPHLAKKRVDFLNAQAALVEATAADALRSKASTPLPAITRLAQAGKGVAYDLWLAMTSRFHETSYYIVSELWGSIVLSVLFWGFTNSICKVSETRRFYPLLGCAANFATSFTNWIPALCKKMAGPELSKKAFEFRVFEHRFYCGLVLMACVITLACYHWMQIHVVNDPRLCPQETKASKTKRQASSKLNVWGDSYLKNIGFMVVAYGIMSQLIETVYKEQLKNYCAAKFVHLPLAERESSTKSAISAFQSNITAWSGRIALAVGLIGANGIIGHLGWTFAALITPLVMLATGVMSLSTAAFATPLLAWGFNPTELGAHLGGLQIILSKGTKYTLFDSTKEMAYLPLDQETKAAAKAEIDLVGARFGKAGGAIYNFTLLNLFFKSNPIGVAPISLALVTTFGIYWTYAVSALGRQYVRLAQEKQAQEEAQRL